MNYGNGLAPESALIYADGIHIGPSAGARFIAFQSWAATQGRSIHIPRLGGYRTIAEQTQLWNASRGRGTGGSTVNIALPGYSTHGNLGIERVDIVGADGYSYTATELAFIVANAPRFGLAREFGAADPNHFWTVGSFATTTVTPYASVTRPSDNQEGSDMRFLYITDSVDGNNVPGWVLLNVNTGKLVIIRVDDPNNAQGRANGWASVWGDARSTTRQEMLNAINAIQSTR